MLNKQYIKGMPKKTLNKTKEGTCTKPKTKEANKQNKKKKKKTKQDQQNQDGGRKEDLRQKSINFKTTIF